MHRVDCWFCRLEFKSCWVAITLHQKLSVGYGWRFQGLKLFFLLSFFLRKHSPITNTSEIISPRMQKNLSGSGLFLTMCLCFPGTQNCSRLCNRKISIATSEKRLISNVLAEKNRKSSENSRSLVCLLLSLKHFFPANFFFRERHGKSKKLRRMRNENQYRQTYWKSLWRKTARTLWEIHWIFRDVELAQLLWTHCEDERFPRIDEEKNIS